MKIELVEIVTKDDVEYHVTINGNQVRNSVVLKSDFDMADGAYWVAKGLYQKIKKEYSLRGTESTTILISEEI